MRALVISIPLWLLLAMAAFAQPTLSAYSLSAGDDYQPLPVAIFRLHNSTD
jgi:hypothetical protein